MRYMRATQIIMPILLNVTKEYSFLIKGGGV
jgi:hypothetical protein